MIMLVINPYLMISMFLIRGKPSMERRVMKRMEGVMMEKRTRRHTRERCSHPMS